QTNGQPGGVDLDGQGLVAGRGCRWFTREIFTVFCLAVRGKPCNDSRVRDISHRQKTAHFTHSAPQKSSIRPCKNHTALIRWPGALRDGKNRQKEGIKTTWPRSCEAKLEDSCTDRH